MWSFICAWLAFVLIGGCLPRHMPLFLVESSSASEEDDSQENLATCRAGQKSPQPRSKRRGPCKPILAGSNHSGSTLVVIHPAFSVLDRSLSARDSCTIPLRC